MKRMGIVRIGQVPDSETRWNAGALLYGPLGHASIVVMNCEPESGSYLTHHYARGCRKCDRTLCAMCDFEPYRGHTGGTSANRYKDCADCRWEPECVKCGQGFGPLHETPGCLYSGVTVDMRSEMCPRCIKDVWAKADEATRAAYQRRLAAQRAQRRANPPEPGKAWTASATRRIADYGTGAQVEEFTRAEVVEGPNGGVCACAICGHPDDLVLDHVNPLAAGGGHTLSNVRLLCADCNGWKVGEIDMPLIEAARSRAKKAEHALAA